MVTGIGPGTHLVGGLITLVLGLILIAGTVWLSLALACVL